MRFKSLYLYLAGGTLALLLFVYELVRYYSKLSSSDIVLSGIPFVLLYYLSFKVYHEDRDDELM